MGNQTLSEDNEAGYSEDKIYWVINTLLNVFCSMSTLSTQLCTECNTFNCIHVDTVDTCIFTCSFYTDSLKKWHTGNSWDTTTRPLLHQSLQTKNTCMGRVWSAQWSGPRVLSGPSTKHGKITWWAWWRTPTLLAIHARGVTLQPQDIQLACRIWREKTCMDMGY